MGLIPKNHPVELNQALCKSILDTFSLVIINEYDLVGSNYEIFQNIKGNEVSRSIKIIPEFDDIIDEQTYIKIKNNKKKCLIQLSSMCFTKESWKIIENIDVLPTLESLLICKKLLNNKESGYQQLL